MKKLIFLFLTFLIGCSVAGDYDAFAQCLSDNDAVMYGTEWCSHCQDQKASFGKSFRLVNFVDCDLNKAECVKQGIKGYPTWIINNERFSGNQPLYNLASYAGCELE